MSPNETPFLEMQMPLPGGKTHVLHLDEAAAKEALQEMETWGENCSPDCKALRESLREKFKPQIKNP